MSTFFKVGSGSAQGAETAFTQWLLRRLVGALRPETGAFELAMANSYMISADQAHACHPNYGSKHEVYIRKNGSKTGAPSLLIFQKMLTFEISNLAKSDF